MLVDDAVTRIDDQVAALSGRVEGALELAEMVRRNALPNVTPHAYVVPLGFRPLGTGEASAGAFTQDVDEIVGVVLVIHSAGDVTGRKALATVGPLIAATIDAVAGWGPESAIGVFRLQRGALISLNAGFVIYQIDFAIQDQLRNLS